MFAREKYIPIYAQIKADLEKLIDTLKADDQIPSEHELMQQYNVSRATVKQAITELVQEERLYRVQGKGTFVSHMKIKRSFDILPTFTDEIRRQGIEPRSDLTFFGPVHNRPEANQALRMPESAAVLCYSRVIYAGEVPIAMASSYVNPATYPNLSADMIRNSLYKALRKHYNRVPTKMVESYCAISAPRAVAQMLKVGEAAALFYCVRVASLEDDTPVEYVESFIRGDQYFIEISTAQSDSAQSVEHHVEQLQELLG